MTNMQCPVCQETLKSSDGRGLRSMCVPGAGACGWTAGNSTSSSSARRPRRIGRKTVGTSMTTTIGIRGGDGRSGLSCSIEPVREGSL